jgi:hypothetical protein
MRIRHRTDHRHTYKLIEESEHFYICCIGGDTPNDHSSFSKKYYEPVPTETWRDVTDECEFRYRVKNNTAGYELYVNGAREFFEDVYRVRKVQLCKHGDYEHAFIIEKREP